MCGQHRAKYSTNKKKVFCKNVIRDGVCKDPNCIHSHNIEHVSSGENFVLLLEHGINFAMKKDGFRHLIMQRLKKNIPLDVLYVKHVKQCDDEPNKFKVVRYYKNDEPNDSKIWKLRDETSSALVFYGEGINDSEVREKIRDLIHEISAKFKAKMYPVKKYPCSSLVKNSFNEDGKNNFYSENFVVVCNPKRPTDKTDRSLVISAFDHDGMQEGIEFIEKHLHIRRIPLEVDSSSSRYMKKIFREPESSQSLLLRKDQH